MKIHEILETRLDELKVNKTQFDTILSDASIRMGFEVECITSTKIPDDPEPEPYINPSEPDMPWRVVKHYLERDDGYNAFENAYLEWLGDRDNETVPEQEYVDAEFDGDNQKVIDHFGLTMEMETPEEVDPRYAYDSISGELRELFNEEVEVFTEYHQDEKTPDHWYIEPDSSISSSLNNVPIEIVSPVFDLKDGLASMKTLFDYMVQEEWYTNHTTGLHINLSIKGKNEGDFDYLKMMVFYEEKFVASFFDRLDYKHAKRLQDKLFGSMTDGASINTRVTADVLEQLKELGQKFSSIFDKYYSINNRGNGVFEFRSMGGAYYHEKYPDIRKFVVGMANILKVGCDPDAMQREYIAKIHDLLNNGKFGDGKEIDISPSLGSFAEYFKKYPKLLKLSKTEDFKFLRQLMAGVSAKASKDNIDVGTAAQKRQLRMYAKKNNIGQSDTKMYFDNDGSFFLYKILCAFMGWTTAKDKYKNYSDIPENVREMFYSILGGQHKHGFVKTKSNALSIVANVLKNAPNMPNILVQTDDGVKPLLEAVVDAWIKQSGADISD